ncbi:rhodanese-like domain-containing protein [Adlercreutzia sp. R25]|uniref:rhodanese-like domain-containing protein n=1 Tax=Adlercreutzia shanghongiae TaxID=3111773 RepID=UPI002DB6CB61|nr:rhodanese-like domain-containing protein [Adlercreutzia sp. R25]MEC4273697.1 rhodanese-like domain-containing protein [Adlercreutzia sp. R25]
MTNSSGEEEQALSAQGPKDSGAVEDTEASPAAAADTGYDANADASVGGGTGATWKDNEGVGIGVVPDAQRISAAELSEVIAQDASLQVIDVRSVRDFAEGYIPGSKNIPAGGQFDIRIDEVDAGSPVAIVASEDDAMGAAWQTLVDAGHRPEDVVVLSGGMTAWQEGGYALMKKDVQLHC